MYPNTKSTDTSLGNAFSLNPYIKSCRPLCSIFVKEFDDIYKFYMLKHAEVMMAISIYDVIFT